MCVYTDWRNRRSLERSDVHLLSRSLSTFLAYVAEDPLYARDHLYQEILVLSYDIERERSGCN